MNDCKLGAVESRFADLIWQNEPIASTALVKLAEQELSWKKSTTYTVLKRLSQRGIFQNQDGTVTSLLSREAFMPHRANSLWRKPSPAPSPRSSLRSPPEKSCQRMTWTSSRG